MSRMGVILGRSPTVVRRLSRKGHTAYLVGGCVRDLLLGRQPKDFDIGTSARPRQVKRLFRNSRCILIGCWASLLLAAAGQGDYPACD